jgi:hypothetical protein
MLFTETLQGRGHLMILLLLILGSQGEGEVTCGSPERDEEKGQSEGAEYD